MKHRTISLTQRALLVGLSVFVVAALAIQARSTYNAQVTADEPQYLLTAISIGEDFDLDISDEINEGRFRSFHEVNLNPQTIALNESGQKISPHDPLLPILLALPMKLGGWQAAKATLAFITGLTAAATLWLAVRRFNIAPTTATWIVAALFCAPPLTSYGTQIYPAMPAALCVVLGVAGATDVSSKFWSWISALMVVCLPWLGIKYVPLAAVIAVFLVWQSRQSPGWTLRLQCLFFLLSGALYIVIHQRVYGSWTVYATGDHFVNSEWAVVGNSPNYGGRTRRLIGLIVDNRFGIAAWTPIYLLIPMTLTRMIRKRDEHWQLVTSLCLTGWAVATWVALTMHGWWWSGRQIVAVLPLFVVLLAKAVGRNRRRLSFAIAGAAIGTFSWLWLVYETSTGKHTLIVDFERTSNPWYQLWQNLLPDHQIMSASDHVLTAAWFAIFAIACTKVWTRPDSQSAINSESA